MAEIKQAGSLCGIRYSRQIQKLADEEAGRLFKALYAFRSDGGRDVDLGPAADVLFDLMADDIEDNAARYDKAAAANNGWKGKPDRTRSRR